MRIKPLASALCALSFVLGGPALADDPNDPAMKLKAAREADAAQVRLLNQAEAARVTERDAGYAQNWQAWRDAREGQLVYDSRAQASYAEDMHAYEAARRANDADREAYARARSDYETAMANWRNDVSACRAGYTEHCAR